MTLRVVAPGNFLIPKKRPLSKEKAKEYRIQNREKIYTYRQAWAKKNLEKIRKYNQKESNKKYQKKYREENKEYFTEWDKKNREKRREYLRRWRKKKKMLDSVKNQFNSGGEEGADPVRRLNYVLRLRKIQASRWLQGILRVLVGMCDRGREKKRENHSRWRKKKKMLDSVKNQFNSGG